MLGKWGKGALSHSPKPQTTDLYDTKRNDRNLGKEMKRWEQLEFEEKRSGEVGEDLGIGEGLGKGRGL